MFKHTIKHTFKYTLKHTLTALCLASAVLLTGCTKTDSPGAEQEGTGYYSVRVKLCEWAVFCDVRYASPKQVSSTMCYSDANDIIEMIERKRQRFYQSSHVDCASVNPKYVTFSWGEFGMEQFINQH
jgi:hypothetical protein